MTEAARKQRNTDRMKELHPVFAARIKAIIAALEALGERPRIQDAWRSEQQQLEDFNNGFSTVKYGFHNVTGAGGKKEGLAVDLLDDNYPTGNAPDNSYFLKVAYVAEQNKCLSGIRWNGKKPVVTAADITAINKAIAAKNWKAKVRIGFDPTHIEPADLTIAQAKNGKRPV